jgi:hypothetical protein
MTVRRGADRRPVRRVYNHNVLGRRAGWEALVRCGSTGMPPVDVIACERVGVEAMDGVWASDHAGLVTDLAPYPERPSWG